MEKVDCIVIGAGVIGLAVAARLSEANREVIIVEKNSATRFVFFHVILKLEFTFLYNDKYLLLFPTNIFGDYTKFRISHKFVT